MLNDQELEEMRRVARQCRRDIVLMTHKAGSGHPGGSLSAIDVLVVLYLRHMRIRPKEPLWRERDMFFLSKGHCTPAYYAAMAARGLIAHEELMTFRAMRTRLQGHPSNTHLPWVDSSSGSLGQGLSVANGAALAARHDGVTARYYVMLGDGEIQEGQVWEAAMTAAAHHLDSVCAVLDANGIQLDGAVEGVKSVGDVSAKWRAFGWNVIEVDGHDLRAVDTALETAAQARGVPTIIIARTVKGKGVSFMENTSAFHGKAPSDEELRQALEELEEPV
ncbi:transketolase [Actinomyces wuliandei]|uniref:transketolase n=1 Tax=Actinomyces wuliandei TaxID=2057743 RepID=UPI000FD8CB2D|nr:transketolase [Actinomyces wuliandei]